MTTKKLEGYRLVKFNSHHRILSAKMNDSFSLENRILFFIPGAQNLSEGCVAHTG
jgi:hypothetical protein